MKVSRRKKNYTFETLIQLMKNRQGLVILFLTLAFPLTYVLSQEPQSMQQNASYDTADTTRPHISLTNPINGSTVTSSQPLQIKARATDDTAVSRIDFSVNDMVICQDITDTNGFMCTWNIPEQHEESYTISAKAFDTSGNSSSVLIKVFVN